MTPKAKPQCSYKPESSGKTAYDLLDEGEFIVDIDDELYEGTIKRLHENAKLEAAKECGFVSVREAESWMNDMNHWLDQGLTYQQALVETDRQWANRLNGRRPIGWRHEQFAGCYAFGNF